MKVLRQIRDRYSVRSYLDKPVEDGKLERVLDAARLAPSARNTQQWRFVVVTDADKRGALAVAANNQDFVAQAPAVIAGCALQPEYLMRCGHPAFLIDLGIAMEHIALQAVEEGLGTCWVGSFYPDQARKILGIPENVAVVELMTLGYPADSAGPKKRLELANIACRERWGFG